MSNLLDMHAPPEDAAHLWEQLLCAVRELPGQSRYPEWLQGCRAAFVSGNELAVEVPHTFAKEFMEKRWRSEMERLLERLAGRRLRLRFVVDPSVGDVAAADTPAESPRAGRQARPRPAVSAGMPLNGRYQFDTFVVGPCNRFAYGAALAVARAPGGPYNPFFLRGGVGVGKTHLLQAIAREIAGQDASARVAYVPADTFTYEFISAIRERRCDLFRKRYRTLDVWVVDDMHFVARKESTEEEFFLTLAALQERGCQIILASDRYPREMGLLEDRLRTRCESGLIVEISPPDVETRLQILRRKAEAENVDVSEDVLLFVANLVDSNVRTLEGALIKLLAYSSLTRNPLTEGLARDVLQGYHASRSDARVTVERIQRAVCDHFQVDLKALKGKRRHKEIVLPRQVAMYLARELTDAPLADIGHRFGGRDHSTVIAACAKIRGVLEQDSDLRSSVEALSRKVRGPE